MQTHSVFARVQLALRRVLADNPETTPAPGIWPSGWSWLWLMMASALLAACSGLRSPGPDGDHGGVQRNAEFVSDLSDRQLDPLVRKKLPLDPPPSCNPAQLSLTNWPLDGPQGKKWLINNYVDLDPATPAPKTGRATPARRR